MIGLIRSLMMGIGAATAASVPAAATVTVPEVNGVAVTLNMRTWQEHRFVATVPQQHDFSCGSAALATLLRYHYGTAVSEDEVFRDMYERGDQAKIRREGFSMLDMKSYLDRHGFAAGGYRVPIRALAEARVPAIALISEDRYNHFIVIKGLHSDRVLIGDPAKGARTLNVDEFERVWKNGIVLMISQQDHRVPSFNSPSDWDAAPLAPLAMG